MFDVEFLYSKLLKAGTALALVMLSIVPAFGGNKGGDAENNLWSVGKPPRATKSYRKVRSRAPLDLSVRMSADEINNVNLIIDDTKGKRRKSKLIQADEAIHERKDEIFLSPPQLIKYRTTIDNINPELFPSTIAFQLSEKVIKEDASYKLIINHRTMGLNTKVILYEQQDIDARKVTLRNIFSYQAYWEKFLPELGREFRDYNKVQYSDLKPPPSDNEIVDILFGKSRPNRIPDFMIAKQRFEGLAKADRPYAKIFNPPEQIPTYEEYWEKFLPELGREFRDYNKVQYSDLKPPPSDDEIVDILFGKSRPNRFPDFMIAKQRFEGLAKTDRPYAKIFNPPEDAEFISAGLNTPPPYQLVGELPQSTKFTKSEFPINSKYMMSMLAGKTKSPNELSQLSFLLGFQGISDISSLELTSDDQTVFSLTLGDTTSESQEGVILTQGNQKRDINTWSIAKEEIDYPQLAEDGRDKLAHSIKYVLRLPAEEVNPNYSYTLSIAHRTLNHDTPVEVFNKQKKEYVVIGSLPNSTDLTTTLIPVDASIVTALLNVPRIQRSLPALPKREMVGELNIRKETYANLTDAELKERETVYSNQILFLDEEIKELNRLGYTEGSDGKQTLISDEETRLKLNKERLDKRKEIERLKEELSIIRTQLGEKKNKDFLLIVQEKKQKLDQDAKKLPLLDEEIQGLKKKKEEIDKNIQEKNSLLGVTKQVLEKIKIRRELTDFSADKDEVEREIKTKETELKTLLIDLGDQQRSIEKLESERISTYESFLKARHHEETKKLKRSESLSNIQKKISQKPEGGNLLDQIKRHGSSSLKKSTAEKRESFSDLTLRFLPLLSTKIEKVEEEEDGEDEFTLEEREVRKRDEERALKIKEEDERKEKLALEEAEKARKESKAESSQPPSNPETIQPAPQSSLNVEIEMRKRRQIMYGKETDSEDDDDDWD
ncbi:MAG: hypothetical protein K2X28_06930 [Alphaproteobacteria bacterium]|nr:hypothetical protein [Alphaproteobacteria bacterium]